MYMKMIAKKTCLRCKEPKEVLFPVSNGRTEKIYYICRECNAFYRKKYRETLKGKQTLYSEELRLRKLYPEKFSARAAARRAVRSGVLIKTLCRCGSDKVEAHHENYSKLLEVLWMCRRCHYNYHRGVQNKD